MTISLTGGLSFSGGFTFEAATPEPNTAGWFGGGGGGPAQPSSGVIVNRITFATDTNTASVRGPLSVARSSLAAAGGIQ